MKSFQIHETWLAPFVDRIPKGSVFLDVGANTGTWSRALADRFDRVVAIEPQALSGLRENLPDNVEIIEAAAGSEAGTADLHMHGASTEQATLSKIHPLSGTEGKVVCEVPVITIDSLDLRDVGFLKIDVEGFGPQVLEGALETMVRCRPPVLLEVHSRTSGVRCREIMAGCEFPEPFEIRHPGYEKGSVGYDNHYWLVWGIAR